MIMMMMTAPAEYHRSRRFCELCEWVGLFWGRPVDDNLRIKSSEYLRVVSYIGFRPLLDFSNKYVQRKCAGRARMQGEFSKWHFFHFPSNKIEFEAIFKNCVIFYLRMMFIFVF